MKDTVRKPDVVYYKNSAQSVTAIGSEKAIETTKGFVSATMTTPNDTTRPGGTLLIIISIENISEGEIKCVTVIDKLIDAHMKYIENSAILHSDGHAPESVEVQDREEGICFFIDRKLLPGEIQYLSFMAQANDETLPTALCNYATVLDSSSEAKSMTNSIKINSEYGKITAERNVIKSNCRCNETTITILLKNDGNIPCKDVTVTDTLESSFEISSVYFNDDLLAKDDDYLYFSNELTINIPSDINPSETVNIIIKGR